jgi:hypothetical protein
MAVTVVAIGTGLIIPAIGAVIENGPGFAGAITMMALGLVLSIVFSSGLRRSGLQFSRFCGFRCTAK